ncbi:putative chemoreceptor glutamine deamidase CheD [Hyphomicrobiales bacterium]|nr:putative chemoreceptor glutamine deamidase CheD [Hyphomicrobiales bacterium]CAH1699917.1 putative chemoreceptor glutamine deamidase CheD [Hyphomicrobiales bacterium]CAI0343676.1 putative chemoreceptor glutamine deamidase CheD [Hyphomicrobiales bacterium]
MSVTRSSRRYFDPRFEATIITVAPGEHEITSAKDEIVATVLGSCISVCMRDPHVGVGGLNHFLLPKNNGSSDASAGERYGDTAMEMLINGLLKRGARRQNFEAKVFGGARVLSGATMLAIGDNNIAFVNEFLRVEGIPVVSKDVGGTRSRRIHYQPSTGRAWVQHVQPTARDSGQEQEIAYLNRLKSQPVAGEVEVW